MLNVLEGGKTSPGSVLEPEILLKFEKEEKWESAVRTVEERKS